jgi:hypothetical protein
LKIKVSYLGLASLERTIARQRARVASLNDGDASTSFFHRQCTYQRQKNKIHCLADGDRILTEHRDMAEAADLHFDGLLGTDVVRTHTLDLSHLIEPSDSLEDMDAPFSVDEIWDAVKRLPARKAPG